MCHRKGKKTANQESPLKGTKDQRDPYEAPPGEFERILEEMEKRGIEPKIRKELKKKS